MRSTSSRQTDNVSPSPLRAEPAPIDRDLIANLSDQNILDMDADELIRVINASQHPWRSRQNPAHFARTDLETLRRMAFKARLCCRNAIAGGDYEEPDVRTDDSGIWMYGAG